jgi:hypothetical protein
LALTEAQKAELIRRGNTLFNEGRFFEAGRVFTTVGYKTGLIRLGDLFYFEKEMPLVAYGFYRNANHRPMLDKIGEGFVFALKCLLYEPAADNPKADSGAKSVLPKKSVASMGDDSVRVRQSNSPDAGSMAKPSAVPETLDSKVARAVAMLQKLG